MRPIACLTVSALALAAGAQLAGASAAEAPKAPYNQAESHWYKDAEAALAAREAEKPARAATRAKNVILFLGDGMDPTTVTAARIFDGQSKGMSGEENQLSFEKFPYLAMSKTYNTDAQVPDSAGTMSAIVTGVKTRIGSLSVGEDVKNGDCAAALKDPMTTLGELSELAGMATGVVTTTRVTHATPGAVYAHSADRGWENDAAMPARAAACKDIARQLIEFPYGDGLEVAMGGGRADFQTVDESDPEDAGKTGLRKDGRDLTQEWTAKSSDHAYIWNEKQFEALDPETAPKVLALFDRSHMKYEHDRAGDPGGEPSLTEMTEKAIAILSNNKKGYFLMVEGGRIDHAHHAGNARRALEETQSFANAVAAARAMTDPKDTLIIVTADHGHTLTMQGYPKRGNPILGLSYPPMDDQGDAEHPVHAGDGKPYTTLAYANGPGSIFAGEDGPQTRPELTQEQALDPDFRQQSLIPNHSETHGGQDVIIYADGPGAYLFRGTVEENYTFHVVTHALDLERRAGVK